MGEWGGEATLPSTCMLTIIIVCISCEEKEKLLERIFILKKYQYHVCENVHTPYITLNATFSLASFKFFNSCARLEKKRKEKKRKEKKRKEKVHLMLPSTIAFPIYKHYVYPSAFHMLS